MQSEIQEKIMKESQKTKSRAKLYNAVSGVNALVGAAGFSATMDVVFTNNPSAAETLIITQGSNTTTFTFGDGTGGTVDSTTNLPTTLDNLRAAVLADSWLGAWGVLYPVNSEGVSDDNTDTLTFKFWPGSWANAAFTVTGTAEITGTPAAADGVDVKIVSSAYKYNTIDTTGSNDNKEYYILPDGGTPGETAKVVILAAAGSDTPTLVGKLSDAGSPHE